MIKGDGMGASISTILLDSMVYEARKAKLYYTGLWPLYWATFIPPMLRPMPAELTEPPHGTKYFLGRKRMVAYIVRMKLKYPDLVIEKY